jgi:hypothetical protein
MSAEVFNFDNAFLAVSHVLAIFRVSQMWMGLIPRVQRTPSLPPERPTPLFCVVTNISTAECCPYHLQPGRGCCPCCLRSVSRGLCLDCFQDLS